MSKLVFGRGGRRKRRRCRVVPPKGASGLWPMHAGSLDLA